MSYGARRPRFKWIAFTLLLLFVVVALATWSGDDAPHIEPGSALVITMQGPLRESPADSLFGAFSGEGGTALLDAVARLRKAVHDERIETVVLRLRGLNAGWARAGELRAAFQALGEAGKTTVAMMELEGYGNISYYLASAAQQVVIAPAAHNPFLGLAGETYYWGGFLEFLGIKVEYERVGRYKSAVETLAHDESSADAREMTKSLLDSVNRVFLNAISESRNISPEKLAELIDRGLTTPDEMVEAGLADSIAWYDHLMDSLGSPPVVSAGKYDKVPLAALGIRSGGRVALVYGDGPVVVDAGGSGGDPVMSAVRVGAALRKVAKDKSIQAVVFRINSPGGSPLASDMIWREVERLKEKKPVVVSMSDVAASGGYYAASAAHLLVSNPATLTGSIGVFAIRPSLDALYDKLKIGVETQTRGARADLVLSSGPLSSGARDVLKRSVDDIYRVFLRRTHVGRGMTLSQEEIDAVGQGRVWTGAQAMEIGLVDELGGLVQAVAAAKRMAGIDPELSVELVEYPAPKSIFEQIDDLLDGGLQVGVTAIPGVPHALWDAAQTLQHFESGQPLLLPPVWVEIR